MTTLAQLQTPAGSSRPDGARTKLVIRRLPPTLPAEIFWKSVVNWVSEESTSWKQYIVGRKGDEHDAHPVFSRAYVLFKSPEAVLEFRQAYDGHVFRAKTGEEYQAVVEYAPIQRTPLSVKVKVDSRQGTIDDDPDYLSFLQILKTPAEKAVLEVSAPIAQPTSTPLLDHLRIHGRGGKGSKKQKTTTASSSDARGRAIASVTAAAAKRAPHADNGPILVAGKGRDVTIAESVPPPAPAPAPTAGKKSRAKKRDKAPSIATMDGSPGQPQAPQTPAQQSLPPRPSKAPKPRQDRPKVDQGSNQPPAAREGKGDGETAGREPRNTQGRSRRVDGPGEGGGGEVQGVSNAGRGRGGRGGRRGGGAGGERGAGADGKDRSAKSTVVSILSRNAEAAEGRGGGPGRGRGRGRGGGGGGGPGSAPASTARIDD